MSLQTEFLEAFYGVFKVLLGWEAVSKPSLGKRVAGEA